MTYAKWAAVTSPQLTKMFLDWFQRYGTGTGKTASEYFEADKKFWINLLNAENLHEDVPELTTIFCKLSSEPHTMLEFKVIQKNNTKKLLMPVNGAWQEIPTNILRNRDIGIPFYQNADWVSYHVQVGYTIGTLEITENHVDHFWKWYDRITN